MTLQWMNRNRPRRAGNRPSRRSAPTTGKSTPCTGKPAFTRAATKPVAKPTSGQLSASNTPDMSQPCNVTGNPPPKCFGRLEGRVYVNRQRPSPSIRRRRSYGHHARSHHWKAENIRGSVSPSNRDDALGGIPQLAIRL